MYNGVSCYGENAGTGHEPGPAPLLPYLPGSAFFSEQTEKPYMNILGISAFYHDSAACLVQSGRVVAAAQEERFTRKKHDQRFPVSAIDYCLKNSGITVGDIDYIAFYEKPFLKFERLLETSLAYAPYGLRSFVKAMPVWIKQKLWIKEIIKKETGFEGRVLFPEHHESHAASAFFPSPFDEAAVLTLDGVGEWTTTSYGVGKGNNLDLAADIQKRLRSHPTPLDHAHYAGLLDHVQPATAVRCHGNVHRFTQTLRDLLQRHLRKTGPGRRLDAGDGRLRRRRPQQRCQQARTDPFPRE